MANQTIDGTLGPQNFGYQMPRSDSTQQQSSKDIDFEIKNSFEPSEMIDDYIDMVPKRKYARRTHL